MQTKKRVAQRSLSARRRKKTLVVDQQLLDQARVALGVRTETETVMRALELVVQREEQAQGLEELAKLGPIDAARID